MQNSFNKLFKRLQDKLKELQKTYQTGEHTENENIYNYNQLITIMQKLNEY